MGIVIFILVLSFLVLIHELGHYLVARLFKVGVEEFGLGYPPRAVTLFTRWGTAFSLNWIPFGGFVKLEGEDGPEETPASKKVLGQPFYAKNMVQRLAIILAGATCNLVFGIIAFSIVFSVTGIPKLSTQPRIGALAPNSPAATAQLPVNANIVSIKAGETTRDLTSTDEVIQAVKDFQGQTVTVVTTGECKELDCDQTRREFPVTIRTEANTPTGQGLLGVQFAPVVEYQFYPWYEQWLRGSWFGVQQTFFLGGAILEALKTMVVNLVTQGTVPTEVMGPVGIVSEANRNQLFSQGWLMILSFAGMLSINLAVMNVLPIPALDGGRAFFIFLEAIVGKKKIQRVEGYAHYVGYVLLLAMIVAVTARDIWQIVGPK